MKTPSLTPRPIGVLLILMAMTHLAGAAAFLWNATSPGANNWNVNANWNPATGNPGVTDTAIFGNTGPSTSPTTVNNIVSVSTSVSGLQFTNTTPAQYTVTQIPAGVTLTITNNYTVGGQGNVDGFRTFATILGEGTLVVTAPTFIIGNNGLTTQSNGTNDLSGLSNFVYNAVSGTMLIGWNQNRSAGVLFLAAVSNYITAGTITQGAGGSSNGGNCDMNLGPGTNVINVGTHNVIQQKENGSLKFATSAGGLRMRGVGGTDSDRATMVVALRNATGTGTTTGSVALNDHPVDMKLSTLTVGSETANAAAVAAVGNFSFNLGTVNATTVNIAACSGNATALATGTINVGTNSAGGAGNGTLIVGTSISLANLSLGAAATGTLNIFGGTVICTNNLVKTSSTSSTGTVAVANSGTLFVQGRIGSPANPIDNFNVTNATLQMNIDASGAIITNAVVGNLNTSGTTTIIINQATSVSGPTTFPLISYTTFNGTVAGNFVVAVPGGYTGSLVDNSAQKRIDLSITPNVILVPLVWTGATNGDWDLVTTNWLSGGTIATYTDNNLLAFDDAAATSTVNLTAQFLPISVVMSNSALTYTFAGTGSLGGTNALTLKGSGTTIIDNTGSNSFTGAITIGAGTLQVGNNDTRGNLPAGISVVDNAALAFKRSDNVTNDNTISGGGTLTQNGGATLTLAGANSYGATMVNSGALQVGAGGSSGTLGGGNVTVNTSLILNRSDNVTIANVISGPGAVTKNNNNTLTLTGASSFGGGVNVNAGTLRLNNVNAPGTSTITVNPGGTVVLGAVQTNSFILAGGTFGISVTENPIIGDFTAANSTTSTFYVADPQNLGTPTDAIELDSTGTWHGNGDVVVATVLNDSSPDNGNGFRLKGTAVSDFSGSITLSNTVKGELLSAVAGPFSPAGTGKMVLTCGVLTNNTVTGNFSELNLRNNSSGSTIFGNNVELAGAGLAVLDPLGTAPVGAAVTMGNLKIGGGQELSVNLNAAPDHVVIFTNVTLNGGNATFSPKTSGWNTTPQIGSDLTLGNISELVAGSGFTMTGLRTLTLTGNSANTYSGPTTNAAGTMILSKTSGNSIPGYLAIPGGTVSLSAGDQIADGATINISGGTLALNSFSDTVGPVMLASGSISGSSGTLFGTSYDVRSGSILANLGGAAILTKSTADTVVLSGTNIYGGSTLINAGTLALAGSGSISNSPSITIDAGATLDASGRADGTLTLATGQTLKGNGTINGSLTVNPGAAVSPGAAIGALTITNVVTLQGVVTMELGAGTNDVIAGAASITYGGTLSLAFTPGSLTTADSFKLFGATSYSGAFAGIIPATPGVDLVWNTNTLSSDGTLRIASASSVNTTPTNIIAVVTANQLDLSWPADHIGWSLQTNSVDLSNTNFWFAIPGSTATNHVIVIMDPAQTNVFYRMVYP